MWIFTNPYEHRWLLLCLQDAMDEESKVEFYLDHTDDNPYPYFTYAKVKPGNYICLVDPVMHLFLDRSIGIRVDHPELVMILEKDMLQGTTISTL